MDIRANGISDAWIKVMRELDSKGQETGPRGLRTKEIISAKIVIENPKKRIITLPIRKMSLPFAFGELAWYLQGRNDVEMMEYYSKKMRSFSDDGETLNSAYGFRMFGKHPMLPFDQWQFVVDKLRQDPDSRQAVIHLKTPNNKPTKDEVCTKDLQFMIREGKLDMVVNMRSNDIVWGFTYDVFSFTTFQELIANELGVEVGRYYHNAASMHIYEKDFGMLHDVRFLFGELLYMASFESEFDYYGLTRHSREWEYLFHNEEVYRESHGERIHIKHESLKVMDEILVMYNVFKTLGRDEVIPLLKYDNIYHCMMRQYLNGRKYNLKNSSMIILEGCDGAGKSTYGEMLQGLSEKDVNIIAFAKPKRDFDKLIYFHTALLLGDHILDRFFYSELVYSRVFRRDGIINNYDMAVLERLLKYRKARMIFLDQDPVVCFERLDENDRKAFTQEDITRICESYNVIYNVSNLLESEGYKIRLSRGNIK